MGDLFLDKGKLVDTTSVSNYFIDSYMPGANGEFVKVYLYLLRCASDSDLDLSLETIADRFTCTESDISRALHYWADLGLLTLSEDSGGHIQGICLERCLPKTPKAKAVSASERPAYTGAQLAAFAQEEDVKNILFTAEQYLGRTLSPKDIETLIYLYDELGFSYELIDYLIEYCVSNNKRRMRYIEKTALNWAEAGITTLEQAKAQTSLFSNKYYPVMRAFGICDHSPAEIERRYINKWLDKFGFPMEIIIEACNRTIAALHKPSFQYADKILTDWQEQNVRTPADIKALDQEYHQRTTTPPPSRGRNEFNNFSHRDYDFDELEKQLLASRK